MKGNVKEQKGIEYYMQLPYSILLHQIEDDGKRYWIAEFPELPGCTSHGSTVDEAVNNAQEAKKDWILDSLEEGDEVPIPIDRDRFSGRILVRMSRSLHRALSLMAESENLSLNQLIVTILAKEVGRLGVLNRVEAKLDELLDRINDVIERDERKISSPINFPNLMAVTDEQDQYLLVNTGSIPQTPAATGVYIGTPSSGIVSTASPFDELWPCAFASQQKQIFKWILPKVHAEKEGESENVVELKPK